MRHYRYPEAFPYLKLLFFTFLFAYTFAAYAQPESRLLDIVVRTEQGVEPLTNKEFLLASTPLNIFALTDGQVSGTVVIDLNGPNSFQRTELQEPYALFDDLKLIALPQGDYLLEVRIVNKAGQVQEQHTVNFSLVSPQQGDSTQSLIL